MADKLISMMIGFPLLGAMAQALVPVLFRKKGSLGGPEGLFRGLALCSSILGSLFGFLTVMGMRGQTSDLQSVEVVEWIGSFSMKYSVGVDGLNALMILLISIVFPILLLSEWNRKSGARGIHALYLFMQACLFGTVASQDLFLLFFFWSATALPIYFLITIWGEKKRDAAAFKYMMSSSLGNSMFFIVLVVAYYSLEPHTFSLRDFLGGRLTENTIGIFNQEFSVAKVSFLLFCAGFVLRIPVWPLHSWFSSFVMQAPASVLAAFSGLFVPVGLYVFLRVSYTLFPLEVLQYSTVLIGFGVINVVYGAISAIAQQNLRLFVGYLCLTQIGITLMGIGSLDSAGIIGATYHGLALGLGLAGFGLFIGFMGEKAKSSFFRDGEDKNLYGGVANHAPILALFVAICFISLLGFPGLGGFIGQSLVLMGGYNVHPVTILFIGMGILLITYSVFSVYRSIFLGKATDGAKQIVDLSVRERVYFVPIVVGLILTGVYPKPLIDLIRPSVLTLLSVVN